MADTETVATSTHEIPTAALERSAEQQCSGSTSSSSTVEGFSPVQIELVDKTWQMVEAGGDLQGVGLILFRK